MNNHERAVDIIEARFSALDAGNDSLHLHAEACMAVEMAYALGAIDCIEHRTYVLRRDAIRTRSHERAAAKIRRFDRVAATR